MRGTLLLCVLLILCGHLSAQKPPVIYKISADSVLLTYCDSTELIIENHTQDTLGFLYNTGKGRTIFKRGVTKINDSLYLIGADTLNLGARAWVQGGNAFGVTGVLGTLDNHHLDFYTNGQQRARLDSIGNLQLNGAAAIAGNLGVGIATITNGGFLINTDAILFKHVVSEFHNYQLNDIYVSRLENVLYGYPWRFDTTMSRSGDTVIIDIQIPNQEFKPQDSALGITYPDGKMCFSFWEGNIPQLISVSVFANDYGGRWVGPFITTTNLCPDVLGYFEVPISGFNYLKHIRIAMLPQPGFGVIPDNIEYIPSNGAPELVSERPYVGKSGNERLYNYLTWYDKALDKNTVAISAKNPNFFVNTVMVGSDADNSSGAKLQVTGGVSASGNIQFSDLTGNNSAPRILASDASGNLYFRDPSSLVADNLTRSSLAVNGPITAEKLTLTARHWPDYVFDTAYRLPSLTSVDAYIRKQHHLPDLPSAGEVEKNGLDVGATQAALLKKIEELTLYTISLERKLAEMDELKARLEKLEQLIKKAEK